MAEAPKQLKQLKLPFGVQTFSSHATKRPRTERPAEDSEPSVEAAQQNTIAICAAKPAKSEDATRSVTSKQAKALRRVKDPPSALERRSKPVQDASPSACIEDVDLLLPSALCSEVTKKPSHQSLASNQNPILHGCTDHLPPPAAEERAQLLSPKVSSCPGSTQSVNQHKANEFGAYASVGCKTCQHGSRSCQSTTSSALPAVELVGGPLRASDHGSSTTLECDGIPPSEQEISNTACIPEQSAFEAKLKSASPNVGRANDSGVDASKMCEAKEFAAMELGDPVVSTGAGQGGMMEATSDVKLGRFVELSEYERERLRNIAENQAALVALGLADSLMSITPKPSAKTRKQGAVAPVPPPRSHRVLRSRNRAEAPPVDAEVAAHAVQEEEDPADEGPSIDYSKVLRYLCTLGPDNAVNVIDRKVKETCTKAIDGLVTWRRSTEELLCPKELTKVYSFASRPAASGRPLLAAGGHAGWTSIWPLASFGHNEESTTPLEPLLVFQAHNSWLGELQFLHGASRGSNGVKLLTSANDGCVRLWDLEHYSARGPNQVLNHEAHTRTTGGIFAMHEVGLRVLTASKDHTVALSSIRDNGSAEVVSRFETIHRGAVRSVRWGGEHVFASGATTGDIVLSDVRAPAETPSTELRRAHGSAVNTLSFCEASEHVMLSSSCDSSMLLHDVRKLGAPFAALVGHTELPRQKAINQPTFCDGGRFVASVGEASPHLSLFCARTGELLSQGELGDHILNKKGSCLHAFRHIGDEALVLANGNVLLTFLPERTL